MKKFKNFNKTEKIAAMIGVGFIVVGVVGVVMCIKK